MFNKTNLQTGDIIVHRNLMAGIIVPSLQTVITIGGFNTLADYDTDLTDIHQSIPSPFDIVRVYRPNIPSQCQFSPDAYTGGTLMYDRRDDLSLTASHALVDERIGWVSCRDRMPDGTYTCAVYCQTTHAMFIAYRTHDGDGWHYRTTGERVSTYHTVTHWTRLPLLWREDAL